MNSTASLRILVLNQINYDSIPLGVVLRVLQTNNLKKSFPATNINNIKNTISNFLMQYNFLKNEY